jgi:hypothetical protein
MVGGINVAQAAERLGLDVTLGLALRFTESRKRL